MAKVKQNFNLEITSEQGDTMASNVGEADTQVHHYQTIETVGKFPAFKCILYGASIDKLFGVDNVTLKYTSELKKYKVKACILSKNYDVSSMKLELQGLFAPKETILTANTQFLGDTVETAINTLGFEQKLHLKSNISSEFHQISETAIHALLRICDCEADIPYWTIGIQDIFLSKQTNVKEFIPLNTTLSIIENTNLDYEVLEENYDEVYYGAKVNTQYIFGNTNNYNALPKGLLNYYMRNMRKPDFIINGRVDGPFPYDIGQLVKNDNTNWKGIKNFVVTSLVNNNTIQDCTYEVQYSYFKNLE